MGTTESLLAVLAGGPRHGYELKREYDEWFPLGRPLAYGQVYAALSRLERDGSVEVVETQAGSGPDRTVYALTAKGQERLDTWLTEPVEPPAPGAGELVRKTVAALHTAADPRPMLGEQRTAYLRRMAELRECDVGGDPVAAIARDHAIEHLDADLRWLDRAADQVSAAVLATQRPTGGRAMRAVQPVPADRGQ